MAEANKSLAGDLLGGIAKNPQVQQQIAGAIMGAVGKFLAGLLARLSGGGDKKPRPVEDDDIPARDGTVVPLPGAPDVPKPAPSGRIWSGLRLRLKGVKRDVDGPNGPAPAFHIPDSELEKVKDLSDPLDDGDVANLTVDPLDQFGNEIKTGSPELEQLLIDPAKGTGAADSGDNHRLLYAVGGGPFEINGTNRNYGCDPNLKVPRGFKGEATAVVSVFATTREGKVLTSNALRLRAKPWN